ncbi:hypothetical protein [Elizabethkingia ursingii]
MNADPFIPSAAILGAKYQWGAQTGETGRYIYQADDQNNSISGWNSSVKPSDSWIDTSKAANGPCPVGYRVPSEVQLHALYNNNSLERVGSWLGNIHDFSSGLYFKNSSNKRTLMLPIAGYRRHANDWHLLLILE